MTKAVGILAVSPSDLIPIIKRWAKSEKCGDDLVVMTGKKWSKDVKPTDADVVICCRNKLLKAIRKQIDPSIREDFSKLLGDYGYSYIIKGDEIHIHTLGIKRWPWKTPANPNNKKDGVKKLVKKISKAGRRLPPHLEIGAGAIMAGTPIPEPVSEVATDIAGVIMISEGVKRIKDRRWKEKIPGGLAAGMRPEDFDADALSKGTKVELEHTHDRNLAMEIAMDHLMEDPKYYERLKSIESSFKRKRKKKSSKKRKR